MSLYKSAVHRPIMTALVFVAFAFFGIFALMKLPINLLPDFENNQIMVMTTYAGASAEDIETNVTKVLENALNSVSDLKDMTSQSKENVSIITLEFEFGIDLDQATNDVRDKLDFVSTSLPDEVESPTIFKFGSEDIPILLLSVTAEESMPGLYKILDDNVATPLARVRGVGQVSISGIAERQIQVYCDPLRLEAYGLSIETIAQVIASENRNIPAGTIDLGSSTYSIRVQKEFNTADEILDVVVAISPSGAPVYLRDVATVTDTQEEKTQEAYTDGLRCGIIMIQKQSGANSVEISDAVYEKLPALQESLPADVKIGVIIDTSENIHDTIDSLTTTVLTTLLVVMLVVLIFLGRWRATFVVVLTIPISLLGSLVYLWATGETLNIISMSALSIAIGMVVDNAIVVLENITTHIERGSKPKMAAIFATNEVAISVVASTLTTIAVFLPLTMVSGMTGVVFKQLGWIVTIILTISTLAALTLTPMLSSQLLRLSTKQNRFQQMIFNPFNRGVDKLRDWYVSVLDWAIRHRKTTMTIAFLLFVVVVIGIGSHLKSEFFPTQDNARIAITAELPIGTRQEVSGELAETLSKRFQREFSEINVLSYMFGQASTDNVIMTIQDNGSHIISFNIGLVSKTERDRGLVSICDRMRDILAEYPAIKKFEVIEGGQKEGIGGQTTVDIEIYGYDFDVTDAIASDISNRMEEVEGCTQVNISRDEYSPEYEVDFDREKLAMNGLNITTAAGYLRNRINGSVSSYFREDGDEYDILVRYDKQHRASVEDIENITIYNSYGNGVKIRDLGRVVESQTPPTIERKNRERTVTVSCVVGEGAAMSDIITAAEQQMAQIDLPAGISWQFGGSFDDQQEIFSDLSTIMVIVIVLVFIIMASQFESLTYPFVIMFAIPFGLVGVILGLWITNTPLGVMAMLGILMLIGIVVNNGIVLIDYIRLCRGRGMNTINAILTAGRSRLRPVLMTTLTTVIGMIPMAVGTGVGSEMWRSLGISVAWGLSFSTVITLILVPTMYCSFAAFGVRRQRKNSLKNS